MNNELKAYLITDPKYYSNNSDLFKKNLTKVLERNKIDIICFRDKESSNFEELAKVFIEVCKRFNIEKILINSDYKLAKQLGANGVHLNSKQFENIKEAKHLDLYVIISCHNFAEIEKAQKAHVNAITYSPIFKTPNKGEPLGINKFKQTLELYEDIDIIALGGIIDKEQISQIEKTKAYGFASIRYFI
ncbi:thiamine phosphate synthase [Poseidonibacter ostreae]|jgi:thiamine-phosphate pyrophosphorylase|uniref:Thiamine phosphate synthase n=1 Tax=Poseidonibacter ostreae TaxID=2654171 RepID=A0A6L4WW33_9BACT|nr:thiamine phosphate synthase [Poseidonibacter ostreae]KAB7887964.1 thiamine phosphate synthase [Poseidonibacter ostreae]KAB7891117.1 thiamine phosphate synthase [Poseidonibacter ostreae]KAB7892841.1 thiamine phosphate synthase [Poseidonibacter ostreae]MAC84681.1 thiamine phosphate synthase [Arcobacter sp.]